MSSSTDNNNTNTTVVPDNKELQQANNNNNNNNQDAAASSSTPVAVVDNKSASQVAISSMFSPSPIPSTEASLAYACAKLQAAALGGGAQTQRPIEISCCLDVSGSMQGTRLQMAQESLKFVVENLRDVDSLGIVTFSSSVTTALNMTKMTAQGKKSALLAINAFRASGSTNLSGGLFAGIAQITGGTFTPTDEDPVNVEPHLRRVNPHRNPHLNPHALGFLSNAVHSIPTPVPVPTPAPVPQTLPVVISFSYDGNGNKPDEKHRYKLSIVPPATDDKIQKFTIHDPQNRFADILGSGESEFDLKPLPSIIQNLEITFDLADGKNHKTNFFMGEVSSAKRTIQIPLAAGGAAANESPAIRPRDNKDDGILRAVFLFTDGHANVGIKDPSRLVAETKKCLAAAPKDATITTFGFGSGFNSALLEGIASASDGMNYFIENTEMMAETFADCLGGICSTVATGVRVTAKLTPGSGVRFSQAMTKFKTEILDDGNTLVIKLKDLYAEEKKDILIEFKVDGPTAKAALVDNNSLVGVSWTLEYSDATIKNSNNSPKVQLQDTTKFIVSSDSQPVVNDEVDEMVQRFKSIEVMNKVREAADAGRLEEARTAANLYGAQLRAAPSASRASNVMLQQQMCNLQEMALDETVWRNRGTKQAAGYAQSHAMQRGNNLDDEDCAYAANAVKKSMRSKATKKG